MTADETPSDWEDIDVDSEEEHFVEPFVIKPKVVNRQFIDLRDFPIFPSYAGLPEYDEIDLFCYREGGLGFMPRCHWCLLGEIVEVNYIGRLYVGVKDRSGALVRIAFDIEIGNAGLTKAQLRRGNTLAVLYAHRHRIFDDSPYARVEETSYVQVFPIKLAELFQLSDKMGIHSNRVNGVSICHGCRRKKEALSKCTKCEMFWYCNKECQSKGWNEKNHKNDCKTLRMPDFKAFLALPWHRFKEFFECAARG